MRHALPPRIWLTAKEMALMFAVMLAILALDDINAVMFKAPHSRQEVRK
jgi:hypothetical protein